MQPHTALQMGFEPQQARRAGEDDELPRGSGRFLQTGQTEEGPDLAMQFSRFFSRFSRFFSNFLDFLDFLLDFLAPDPAPAPASVCFLS